MGCSWLGHLTADISFMWQGHLLKLRRHFVLGLRPAAPPLPHSSLPLGRTRADSERCFVKLWNEPINSQHWEFLEYFLSAALLCNTLKCRGKAWKLEIPKCSCLKKAWQQQGITLWKLAFVYFLFVCGCGCESVLSAPHMCRAPRSHKRALDTPELELEVVSIYRPSTLVGCWEGDRRIPRSLQVS